MRSERWVYVLLIVIGVALGIAIAGVPSSHRDTPLHIPRSTTSSAPTSTTNVP